MGRPRTRQIIQTTCAYCNKLLERAQNTRHPDHNYFCDMDHRNLYKIGRPTKIKHQTKTLIEEYKRISNIVGRRPTMNDLKEHSKIYCSVYHKRFGTLDNLYKIAFPDADLGSSDIHTIRVIKPKNKNDKKIIVVEKSNWNLDNLLDVDGGWLSGICAGEACFRIAMKKNNVTNPQFSCQFQIQLRADDVGALTEIRRLFGLSVPLVIWDRKHDRERGVDAGDGAKLVVRNIPDLWYRVIPTFEKYPMRAKKQNELPLFKRGVQILMEKRLSGRRNSSLTQDEREELEELYWALRKEKKYKGSVEDALNKSPSVFVG